jgi:hypothetical protein
MPTAAHLVAGNEITALDAMRDISSDGPESTFTR